MSTQPNPATASAALASVLEGLRLLAAGHVRDPQEFAGVLHKELADASAAPAPAIGPVEARPVVIIVRGGVAYVEDDAGQTVLIVDYDDLEATEKTADLAPEIREWLEKHDRENLPDDYDAWAAGHPHPYEAADDGLGAPCEFCNLLADDPIHA